jgi:hypothetical protein
MLLEMGVALVGAEVLEPALTRKGIVWSDPP